MADGASVSPDLYARPEESFNFRDPDYGPIFRARMERLIRLRDGTSNMTWDDLKAWYKLHPADFISDWGVTYDPRNIERDKPAVIPFILFPRQREAVDFIIQCWRDQKPGLMPKTRDMGLSWLAVAVANTLCLFYEDMSIGFGSRKEEYVDKSGSSKSLFWKARKFLTGLPIEFQGGWNEKRDSKHMLISFPGTNSSIEGEAGDNIGRGDRKAIYFKDEEAFFERPALIEASLSQTSNCRIGISSANGMGNPFAQKVHDGKTRVFYFHWRDDPRKDEAWYQKQKDELDPVTVAQEIDIDFRASATGILIPSEWVQAAIDAHVILGISPRGERTGALDVADEGIDKNAFAWREGIILRGVPSWSGKGDDIFGTVEQAFLHCDEHGLHSFRYDADGLGAGVRGDARVINEGRRERGLRAVEVTPFRGSATGQALFEPKRQIPTAALTRARDSVERLNEDFFASGKAQGYWNLRVRFQRTFRAVELVRAGGVNPYDPDDLISIDSTMDKKELTQLMMELSQPTYTPKMGKITVDKQPEGTKSPNHADACMICYAPAKRSFLRAYGRG